MPVPLPPPFFYICQIAPPSSFVSGIAASHGGVRQVSLSFLHFGAEASTPSLHAQSRIGIEGGAGLEIMCERLPGHLRRAKRRGVLQGIEGLWGVLNICFGSEDVLG